MGTFAWRPVATGRFMSIPLRLQSQGRFIAPIFTLVIAFVATAAAALVQYLVLPRPSVAPFVFFFLAVAVVAWLSGRGAGLLTVFSSALTANWLFVAPFGDLKLSGGELAATLLFVVGASPVALLCGTLRERFIDAQRASTRLREQAALLERSAATAREAEARFRSLAENSPDLIARFDPALRHRYANAAALRATGLRPDEIVGRTNAELGMPAHLTALWEAHLRRAFESRAPQGMEFELPGPDGPRFFESRLVPEHEKDGRVGTVLVTTRDVTERRRSEERFRTLADSMPQLVWTALPDGTVEYYNQRSALYAGLERGADGAWTWRPAVHPHDADRTAAAWAAAVATGQVYEVEHRVQMADGSYRWHLSRGVPIRSEQGRLLRWYGTATDIHEQKRATEALAESDRRKSEFLGVLSHELRNPLAPIRNSLYVASRTAPGSEQHRRALAVIERQVAQLHRLVDDLLDVTRITRGKIHIERKRVDLLRIAREVVEDHQALFHRNGIALELVSRDGELHVLADEARLAQVIGNLLQNAAKFSPRGARVTVAVRASDASLAELSVEDTGRGIPPDVLTRLFEPFVQAEQSLDRSMGGLGLGLALVKGLVELQGGAVTAHSAGAGKGARFTVTIPRERRRKPHPDAARPSEAASSARRVLVIEDDEDAAVTLQEALQLEGHTVELAFTGVEGVERARVSRPDVIVCDIGLPGMDGFEVARALRADPALASTTLIALSGYALADDVEKARTAGFDVHLPKPADLDELQRSIGGAPGHA